MLLKPMHVKLLGGVAVTIFSWQAHQYYIGNSWMDSLMNMIYGKKTKLQERESAKPCCQTNDESKLSSNSVSDGTIQCNT